MKRKTRKFASGGDIITGLGAVLVGKALYDKYKEGKGKDDDESDYAKKVREFRGSKKDTTETAPEPAKKEEKAEPKEISAGERRAMAASKGQPEMGDIDKDVAESDKALVRTAPKGSKPASKTTAPKAPAPKAEAAAPKTRADEKVGKGYEGLTTLPKYTPNEERPSKPYPKGVKGSTTDPYLRPSLNLGLNERAQADKAFRERRAAEAKEKLDAEAAKKKAKDAAQAKEFRERSLQPLKKGGMVKKYASGGTATSKPEPKKDTMPEWAKNERANRKQDELNKREAEGARKEVKRNMSTFGFKKGGSASSRADGIAIRGKTRA